MCKIDKENILAKIPETIREELFETIAVSEKIKIERIVSKGHSSPPGFWYYQDRAEWVIVIKGKACLIFEEDNATLILEEGDHINIPAHTKHRVEWTQREKETIWLAVHY